MYDGKNFFLVENPINRYSIGSQTRGLRSAADDSETLYLQHESPGKDREGNCLPAPADSFDVHLLTYWPKDALMKGEYKLPPRNRVR